jgi:N-acetylneuraminate lyase
MKNTREKNTGGASAPFQLRGLVAALFTPFHEDGSPNLPAVKPVVDRVIAQGASGLYALGSTGEGPSLTGAERKAVAGAVAAAAAGRVPVIIQVGHTSNAEARELAAHAQAAGADAVSAMPPTYFKPADVPALVDSMAGIAGGAPALPFYYYNLPSFTGVRLDMVEFLRLGARKIPTLRGIKFSDPNLHDLQAALRHDGGRFDIPFGVDEMLLAAFATGAGAAVGSTYNFAAPVYKKAMDAFARGDMAGAREWQFRAVEMINIIITTAGRGGLKAMMSLIGADCGPSRAPIATPGADAKKLLRRRLQKLGFFDWIKQ